MSLLSDVVDMISIVVLTPNGQFSFYTIIAFNGRNDG